MVRRESESDDMSDIAPQTSSGGSTTTRSRGEVLVADTVRRRTPIVSAALVAGAVCGDLARAQASAPPVPIRSIGCGASHRATPSIHVDRRTSKLIERQDH